MSTLVMLCTGRLLDLDDPDPALLTIEVIARGLSRECRFGRQTNGFLSVAEHSIYVSFMVPWPLRVAAMLHDAPEAILGDMVQPFKRRLPDYQAYEHRLAAAVEEAFDLPPGALSDPEIKAADAAAAWAEARATMPHGVNMPLPPADPDLRDRAASLRIACQEPHRAERHYLQEWNRIHWALAAHREKTGTMQEAA